MKNALLIGAFIVCMLMTYGAMKFGKSFIPEYGEWAPNGAHVRTIEAAVQPMVDKCKMDRLDGKLAGFAASYECANPSIREAFVKEGFPHMEKIDAFLKTRVEFGKKADSKEISEAEMNSAIKAALAATLVQEHKN